MKKIVVVFSVILFFNIGSVAQNQGLSFRVGGDYWQTRLNSNNELFGKPSIFSGLVSTYGYRLGLAYEQPVYKSFSVMSDLGYSQGGFDGSNHSFHQKIHQIYLNIATEYNINKLIKVHLGGLVHYNFRKDSTLLAFVVPVNLGISGGISLNLKRFEFGLRYIHYLNYYFDYRKKYTFATYEREYWNVSGLYIGYHFGNKPSTTLGNQGRR